VYSQSHSRWWFAGIAFLLLAQTTASVLLPRSFGLTLITDVVGFLLMLSAVLAYAVNGLASEGRSRLFWVLQATAWGMLLVTQILWMIFELSLREEVPNPFAGDILLFLSEVPILAGLILRPHVEHTKRSPTLGFVDFSLLLLWWLYLYLYFVIPWQYVAPDEALYGLNYNHLVVTENVVTMLVLGALCYQSSGRWRHFYGYFLGAQVISAASDYLANRAIDNHLYYTGSWYELPYSASLALFTVLALIGSGLSPGRESSEGKQYSFAVAKLAMLAVLSLPVMAVWTFLDRNAPAAVTQFRILVTLGTIFLMAFLVFVKQHRLGDELGRINNVLHEASLTDPLTGVRNRRFFDATIEADVGQALRSYADNHDKRNRDLVFYLVDADDFKDVNDRYGHDAGDQVLVEMARRISSAIRLSDVLVRWGGEEFLVVSRYTDRDEAETLAARVLAAVGNTPFIGRNSGQAIHQTCSIGWAAFPWIPENPQALGFEEVLSLADSGLYQAKQSGKNRAIGVLAPGGPASLKQPATAAHQRLVGRLRTHTVCTSGPRLPVA